MRNSLQIQKIKTIFDFISFPLRLFLVLFVTLVDSSLAIFGILLFNRWYKRLNHYRSWAHRLLFFSGVRVETIGKENISKEKSYVFVANHSSYFDIPAAFVAIPNRMRIMYKKELEKIPVFGWYLKYSDFVGIEREAVASARQSLNEALSLIRQDYSVLIFPEGTRSPDGRLGEFKRGALYLAFKSGKEIVPVTIIGAREILPRGSFFFRTGKIKIVIGKPYTNNNIFDKSQMNEIKEYIINDIKENLFGEKDKLNNN